jgi:D-lactate dehydrogenase (cytochrome)
MSMPLASIALRSAAKSAPRCRAVAHAQKRWASSDGGEGHEKRPKKGMSDFHAGLFESITARVEKEKVQQAQQAEMHQRTGRGRFFATVTGMGSAAFMSFNEIDALQLDISRCMEANERL